MFGILFINHTDLRRILTDYNFRWHPLRKNFPTTGYIELFFDESKKKLSYIPVELYQEFREFQYNLSWSSL
jgi:NADH-quinone oxidoreductase subunit C